MNANKEKTEELRNEINECTDRMIGVLDSMDISRYAAIHSLGATIVCVLDSFDDSKIAKELFDHMVHGVTLALSGELDPKQGKSH